jgi:hypothetical protein
MKTYSVNYVDATDIIPKDWNHWFWAALSESSTVTFGDNDHSLINAERFLFELENILDNYEEFYTEEQVNSIKETIADLIEKDVYINL